MRTIAVLLFTVAALAYADFFDDFESYLPGQDPDISPDWSREPSGGYVLVVEDGDDQVVEAFFPDSAYTGYLCEGAGIWDDGSVSMDFNVTGSSAVVSVFARMQLFSGNAYVGGLVVFIQPFTSAFIAHVAPTGEYDMLFTGAGPSMTPDTWANVRLELEGTDTVTLSLYCDGQLTGEVEDSFYALGSGLSGFAFMYDEYEPSMLGDDFEVVLAPQSLQATTFGALKANFSP